MHRLIVAAATWVLDSRYGDSASFHAGTLDVVLVLVMLAAVTATRAAGARWTRSATGSG